MSTTAKQALVLAVGGLFIIACHPSPRSPPVPRALGTRSAGWASARSSRVAAAMMPFVGRLGRLANMTPTAVLLTISSVLLLTISVQLSISVSQLQERLRTTAEAHALLAVRLTELERRDH